MNAVVEPVPDWISIQAREPVGVDRAEVERRASDAGLPPVRWPDPFPLDSRNATLAATFAKQSGRVVAFSLAAAEERAREAGVAELPALVSAGRVRSGANLLDT